MSNAGTARPTAPFEQGDSGASDKTVQRDARKIARESLLTWILMGGSYHTGVEYTAPRFNYWHERFAMASGLHISPKPSIPGSIRYSVVIPTYNRAEILFGTLRSLSEVRLLEETEVIVVDNNSNDHTRAVVEEATVWFPRGVRYVFETEQGRSAALNSGIHACHGEIVLITDDDVRLDADWIGAAGRALADAGRDYVCGKALPIWEKERPAWLPNRGGKHWGVVGLLDYGTEVIKLGAQVPLGLNMAFRRDTFARAGMWNNLVGRRGGSLLGQEVREWGLRAREAGLSGFYIPDMVVHHIIPSDRVSKAYFRRWFYWHGVSRAILFELRGVDMESPEETTLDFSKVPQIMGVPRYMYRSCLHMFTRSLSSAVRRDKVATFENELWLWFFAGILAQRWKSRHRGRQIRTTSSGSDLKPGV